MQPNETLKPRMPEPKPAGAVPEKPFDLDKSDEWVAKVKESIERGKMTPDTSGDMPKSDTSKGEKAPSKEHGDAGLKKMWMDVKDWIQDVRTASTTASEKLDDHSPLIGAARAFINIGLGAGMEKSMDSLWEGIWQGKAPFIERFQIGSGVAEGLNKFVLDDHQGPYKWKARLAHLIKEGSEDVAIGTIYNMIMTFRAQQLFPKVEPKHLIASLSVDALEALMSPNVPHDMEREAIASNNAIKKAKFFDLDQQIGNLRKNGNWSQSQSYEINTDDLKIAEDLKGSESTINSFIQEVRKNSPWMFKGDKTVWTQDNEAVINRLKKEKDDLEHSIDWKTTDWEKAFPHPARKFYVNEIEHFVRSFTNLSNPVTDLGLAMLGDSVLTMKENLDAVRKARKAQGGAPGKKVNLPQADTRRNYSDRKPYEKREYGNKPSYNKDKVYYGKSQWNNKPQDNIEEVLLEKFG